MESNQPDVQAPIGAPGAAAPRTNKLDETHIDELLRSLVEKNGSDLHLCSGVPPILRVDGKLQPTNYDKGTPQICQRLIYDILSDEQIQRFEQNMELDFSYQMQKIARFRVNVFRDRGSVAAAFRLIATRIPTIKDLKLPTKLEELTKLPRGLVLVTGPTGSGKSTTLAAMINAINTDRACHIITVEDPIEYLHQHRFSIINQRELGQDTHSFANALRAVLREDPDVILVGEMRDTETIHLAITAAETGHLVFATLHTNSAAQTIDRMVDVFPPGQQEQVRVQLSNSLMAVICQQLLPKAGQRGRVPANEIMVCTPAIRNLIREAKAHQITSMIQTSGALGMITMDQCLRDLYAKGLITMEVAMEAAQSQDELKKLISTDVNSMQAGSPGGNARPSGR